MGFGGPGFYEASTRQEWGRSSGRMAKTCSVEARTLSYVAPGGQSSKLGGVDIEGTGTRRFFGKIPSGPCNSFGKRHKLFARVYQSAKRACTNSFRVTRERFPSG